MTRNLTFPGLAAVAAVLGACSGDAGRQAAIDQQIAACVSGARKGSVPAENAQAICSCTVNRVAAGKTAEQVREIFSRPPSKGDLEMAGACTVEEMQRVVGGK